MSTRRAYTAEREREREKERQKQRERERVVVATQPISLVVGFTYGLAPHIAYWREREREKGERERKKEREREREKRVYVWRVLSILAKKQRS